MIRDNRLSTDSSGKSDAEEIDKAVSSIRLIESLLGEEEKKTLPENAISLPLVRVLELIPEEFRIEDDTLLVPDRPISIVVDDLFAKLARGKVTLTLDKLVFGIPADLVKPDAFEAASTQVMLPLPDVVAAVDPGALEKHTTQAYRRYNVAAMADPFASPRIPVAEEKPAAPVPEAPAPAAVVPTHAVIAPEPPPVARAAPEPAAACELPSVQEPGPVSVAATVSATVEEPAVAEPPAVVEQPTAPRVEEAVHPAVEPVVVVTTPEPAGTTELPAEKPAVHAAAGSVAEPAEPDVEPAEPDVEPGEMERLGGVNLNTAVAEQLLTLEGVSPAMARNIIAYRNANGPFRSIFHLCRVPGIGRKTFKHITGMPWSEKSLHRKRKLATLVGLPPKEVGHLPTIAQAVARRINFTGCVISDQDGLVLASSGAGDEGDAFGAIVPRLFAQIRETVNISQVGDIETVSLHFGARMFTVAVSGTIYITGIHQSNKLTMGQLQQFGKVAVELAWLLSHRGYVGRVS
ncbi:MAG: helix-hairpin-helix domain-containing protein [bacterium]